MIKKIISYLQLKKIGAYELLVALYPILAGYSYGIIHGNLLFIVILATWGLFKKKHHFKTFWLNIIIAFVMIHEFILMTMINTPGYFINNTISIIIICLCIIPVCKAIDYTKLVGSLNWVSVLSIGGIIYQFGIVFSGSKVSPLKLPFMPDMASTARLYEESIRPSSFFWEPAAFVTFLMVPLFISLTQKKYAWSGVIILAMFLSTSSTGILMSFIMLMTYVLTQKIKFRARIAITIIGAGLVIALMNSPYFEAGVKKIENTDPEKNVRIMNGIFLYQSLNAAEKVFGIEAANVDDYYKKNGGLFYGLDERNIFVPTFWLTLAKYGIFGLALLLYLYVSFLKKDKTLLPYIVVIFIAMFFQSISIGSHTFAYQLLFLYSYLNRKRIISTPTSPKKKS